MRRFRVFVFAAALFLGATYAAAQSPTVLRYSSAAATVLASTITSLTGNSILLTNAAGTGFDMLQFGGTTSAFPAWQRNGTVLISQLADNSGGANIRGNTIQAQGGIQMGSSNRTTFTTTNVTISSGFGTSPSIPATNGAVGFTVNVGTGGTASSGVLAMNATATNGWHVTCNNSTTNTATVFVTKQTAFTTTTVTIGNFNTAGVAAAWVASDVLVCSATAF